MISKVIKNLDLTTIFKDKRFGDLKRWSAKRTIGGSIVIFALNSMSNEISWQGVVLCAIGVLPLCLSMFENRKCNKNCNI